MNVLGILKRKNDEEIVPSPVGMPVFDDAVTQKLENGAQYAIVHTGSATHPGTRDYQEDALFVSEAVSTQDGASMKAYGIVCDGMGGLEHGELASNFTVARMKELLESIDTDEGIEERFLDEIPKIDMGVVEECSAGVSRTTGTTLVAALILGDCLHWVSVGDSRIYILRKGEMIQITQDHTYHMLLMQQVAQGLISVDEAESNPQKDALVSYIGSGMVRYINTNKEGLRLMHGDIVLLCSDGLTKSLSDERISEIIRNQYGDVKEAAHQLTLLAFDSSDGSKDNCSVVLMQYFE